MSPCSIGDEKNFPNKRIIIPEEAGLSVLKCEVLFGHKPGYIASRVSYGAYISPLFDPDKHEERRKFTSAVEGTDRCRNVFKDILQLVIYIYVCFLFK